MATSGEFLGIGKKQRPVSNDDLETRIGVTATVRAYFPDRVLRLWNVLDGRWRALGGMATIAWPLGSQLTPAEAAGIRKQAEGLALNEEGQATVFDSFTSERGYTSLLAGQSQVLSEQLEVNADLQAKLLDEIFGADLEGFSTTRTDLIRDLIPGI